MKTLMALLVLVGMCSSASGAEFFSVDQSKSIPEQIQTNCPSVNIAEVTQVQVKPFESVGWASSGAGKALGKVFSSTGVNLNFSNIEGQLPAQTRAVLLKTDYDNNDGGSEILVDALTLTNSKGNQLSLELNDEVRTLSEDLSAGGEAILLCFEKDESFSAFSAKLTHRNVHGSRPDAGIDVFVTAEPVKALP